MFDIDSIEPERKKKKYKKVYKKGYKRKRGSVVKLK